MENEYLENERITGAKAFANHSHLMHRTARRAGPCLPFSFHVRKDRTE